MNNLEFTILVGLGSLTAGFLGALTGLGGGVVLVPFLTLLFKVDIRYAVGASLVSVIATSSGAAAYLREGFSNIRIAMFLVCPGMTSEHDAKLSSISLRRYAKTQVRLFRLPVKRINLLRGGVAEEERRIIGSHTQPNAPVTCLAKMLQIVDGLDFVIVNVNPHHWGMIFFVQEVDVV